MVPNSTDDEVYHPLHLHLTKAKIRKLASGGGIRVEKHMIHQDEHYGGSLTHLPLHIAKKARRTLKNGKAFNLRFEPHHVHKNMMHGGGLWDWIKGAANDVVSFGKKAVNVIANDILPVLNGVLDVIPINHPYFIAAKAGLKTAEGITKSIDKSVNKRDELEAKAEEARNDALDLEEAAIDLTTAAKDRSLPSAQKIKLLEKAAQAKARIAAKKAEAKKFDAAAKVESKKVATLEKEEASALKKAEDAKNKLVAEAAKLRQQR